MRQALLVIDLQNDYFPDGSFPLWQAEACADRIVAAIKQATAADIPVIHIQHVADPKLGLAPFFNEGTNGAAIFPAILAAAPDAPIIIKHYADSFEQTVLAETLADLKVTELLVCGMMTQNCVTHTAISKAADHYEAIHILPDLCTTVSEMLHMIALHAVSTRVSLTPSTAILPPVS